MRVRRALAAGLLALAGGSALVILAIPASAEVSGKVTVDPASGPPGTQIDAQFQQANTPMQGCWHFPVIFKWERRIVAQAKLDNCVATATFKAPKDARRGPHQVIAYDDKNHLLGWTVFVVTVDPSASPSQSASPGAGKSRGAQSPVPQNTAAAPAIVDPPLTADAATTVDPSVTPVAGGAGSDRDGGSSMLGLALAVGGALMLGGVGILGYLVMRGRRGEPEYALTDETQPIPGLRDDLSGPGGAAPTDTPPRRGVDPTWGGSVAP